MAKKVIVLTLSILLIFNPCVIGAMKSSRETDERMARRLERIEKANYADESVVGQYLTTPEPKIFFPVTGDTAGYTYYDYQHNDVQRRQIAWDPTYDLAHITWMNLVESEIISNRYMDYNVWDGSVWLAAGGIHTTPATGRAGYGGLDLLPDHREVLCYHRTQPTTPNTFWGTTISIEKTTPGLGEFNAYDIPDSVQGQNDKGEWPTMSCSKIARGDTLFMHITHARGATSGSVDKDLGYVRCFEDPTRADTVVCQSPGWASPVLLKVNTKLAPNVVPYRIAIARLGGITSACAPGLEKVAIVYWKNYASSQTQNDLYYVESTTNGDDWMTAGSMTPVKLTSYQGTDTRGYDDLAVVYDMNDELHIMWTTILSTDANDVSLWHWSQSTGIRKAGFATAASATDPGAWNVLIAKFTLGVYPDSNYLYFNYTKFKDGDISATEFANGDLYVKGSTNGGLTWGPENNMTNTNTNGCTSGNCLSEHWSSLAEVVGSDLHVSYVEDKDAGGTVQDEGLATNNAFRYLKYPRPSIPAVPSMTYTPTQLISPVAWATNGGSTGKTMDFDNVGTATLWVNISGPAYVTASPNNFSIAEAGPTQTVNLTFNGASFTDTFLVDSLLIASNDGVVGDGQTYADTQWVRFHFVVTDSFFYPEYDTIEQGIRVTVSNLGTLGNQEEGNGLNYNGYDYLFESTPAFVMSDIDSGGPASFTWLHEQHNFLPMASLQVDSLNVIELLLALAAIATIIYVGHYMLKERCHFLKALWKKWAKKSKPTVSKYKDHGMVIVGESWQNLHQPPPWMGPVYPLSLHKAQTLDPPLGGYFGIAADFDVPFEAATRNTGGYDDTLHMIWLTSDSAGFENFYGGILFLEAAVIEGDDTVQRATEPFGAHVLTNATQLYPFGRYDDDSLYKYMSTPGYSIESDSSQDMNIVMTFVEELTPTDETKIILKYAILVTDQGLADLYEQARDIKRVKPGDANVDGNVSVSDVVYMINYLFKGGVEPWKAYSDANGDANISVSDVVYLINYLFKGGPPPILCWSPYPD